MSVDLERAVDRLVIGDLVIDICAVERRAAEMAELGALGSRRLVSAWLVGLSCGVTCSFFTSASALCVHRR